MTEFKRVFVDTAPIIYYLENSALYVDLIKKFFTKCLEENIQIVTSAITIEEYLVLPYVSGKVELADNFKRFIEYMNIKVVDIDSNIAEQGAKIRGKYKHFFFARTTCQPVWSYD
ncbi:MAG: type II toxin-antitoxin system VapC family toxin [Lachnospiraceae bacterium]|nr:type II toxin-antitoxin system VapC family toxin [Lachnospiraceae bacterium]